MTSCRGIASLEAEATLLTGKDGSIRGPGTGRDLENGTLGPLQGGPLLVINGVITPINGLINRQLVL